MGETTPLPVTPSRAKILRPVERCGFCRLTAREVPVLVQSPDTAVYICGRCVEICVEIIAADRADGRPLEPDGR